MQSDGRTSSKDARCHLCLEFKVDGTPEEALEQINSKGYAIPYQSDHRKVVKIGVNFDSATRSIGDWKIVEID